MTRPDLRATGNGRGWAPPVYVRNMCLVFARSTGREPDGRSSSLSLYPALAFSNSPRKSYDLDMAAAGLAQSPGADRGGGSARVDIVDDTDRAGRLGAAASAKGTLDVLTALGEGETALAPALLELAKQARAKATVA